MTWWKFWEKDNFNNTNVENMKNSKPQVNKSFVLEFTDNVELKEIARTNYFLWQLRKAFDLKVEYNSNWNQVEQAFNGGFFFSETSAPLAVVFFHKNLSFSRDTLKSFRIGETLVSIAIENSTVDLENLLSRANKEFEELVSKRGEIILSQVSRFLLSAEWEGEQNSADIEKFVDRICDDFPTAEIFRFRQTLPLDESIGNYHGFDIEVVLKTPITNKNFIEIIKRRIPNLHQRIFGFGHAENNPFPDMDFWITLYARQF